MKHDLYSPCIASGWYKVAYKIIKYQKVCTTSTLTMKYQPYLCLGKSLVTPVSDGSETFLPIKHFAYPMVSKIVQYKNKDVCKRNRPKNIDFWLNDRIFMTMTHLWAKMP